MQRWKDSSQENRVGYCNIKVTDQRDVKTVSDYREFHISFSIDIYTYSVKSARLIKCHITENMLLVSVL